MKKKLKIPALILGAAIAMGFASCKIDSEDDVSKLLLLISSSGKTVTHSVTFVSNGGTAVNSQTVIHGNKAEKPENPTKTAIGTEKYAFENWYVSEDGGTTLSDTAFDFDTPIEKDITLYANWTVTKLYSVSIATDIKHGAVEASKTSGITEGETITLTVRIDDGYKMDKLSVKNGENEVTVAYYSFTMPASNVTINARFIQKDFIKVNGATVKGEVSGSVVFITGRTVEIPTLWVCDHEVTQKEYSDYCKYVFEGGAVSA